MSRLSLAQTFARAQQSNQIALMPFLAAGYPDLQTWAKLIPALEQAGASAIEIGIPFSDPVADGPIIQEAFTQALAMGIKVEDVFKAVAGVRGQVSIPLMAMVSFSIVFRYGVERFVKRAKESGFDGLIIPDLPPPEAQSICKTIRAGGLDTILLISPSTPTHRRQEIADLSTGFIYYLSLAGITGERAQLPPDVAQNVQQIKSLTKTPVCVGFGINKREHLVGLQGIADGAIVGSAFVRRIKEVAGQSSEVVAQTLQTYARQLLGKSS